LELTTNINYNYYYSFKFTISNIYFKHIFSSLIPCIQVLFTDYSFLLHEGNEMENIQNYSIDLYFKKILFIDKIVRKYIITPNIDNLYTVFNS